MALSVFDGGFSAKVGSSLRGQVQAGPGLIKARGGGVNGSKVQTNFTRSSLNKPPHFAVACTSKHRLSEPQSHLTLQPFATYTFLQLLQGKISSVEASTSMVSGAHFA